MIEVKKNNFLLNEEVNICLNNIIQKKYYQESLSSLEIVLDATKKIISDNKE